MSIEADFDLIKLTVDHYVDDLLAVPNAEQVSEGLVFALKAGMLAAAVCEHVHLRLATQADYDARPMLVMILQHIKDAGTDDNLQWSEQILADAKTSAELEHASRMAAAQRATDIGLPGIEPTT